VKLGENQSIFSKKTTIAHLKELIETSLMQVSVCP